MKIETIVLCVALLGSILYLWDKVVATFAGASERRKAAEAAAAQERAEAHAEKQKQHLEAMQSRAMQLVQSLQGFQSELSGMATSFAAANPIAAQTSVNMGVVASGNGDSLDQKLQLLATSVLSQSSQIETLRGSVEALTERLNAADKPKRRVTRKATEGSLGMPDGIPPAPMESHAMEIPPYPQPMEDSTPVAPIAKQNEGKFDIVA